MILRVTVARMDHPAIDILNHVEDNVFSECAYKIICQAGQEKFG